MCVAFQQAINTAIGRLLKQTAYEGGETEAKMKAENVVRTPLSHRGARRRLGAVVGLIPREAVILLGTRPRCRCGRGRREVRTGGIGIASARGVRKGSGQRGDGDRVGTSRIGKRRRRRRRGRANVCGVSMPWWGR